MKVAVKRPKRVRARLSDRLREIEAQKDDISTFVDILEAINHPKGLSIAIKMRYGDYLGVINTEVDPLHYNDTEDFADAYQSVKLVSKYPYLETKIDRRDVALTKFFEAERACLDTNKRFRALRDGVHSEKLNPSVQAIISMAQRKIAEVLGDVRLDDIAKQFGWGPGATIGVRGVNTSAYNKFSGPLDVTRNALAIGLCCINSSPSWANAILETGEYPSIPVSVLPTALRVTPGSEIIFVPKNAKTDRVIAIEPSLNIYVQKGIGGYIRKRLRDRAGIDLDYQDRNQSLAQYGSRTGDLATIDLSMASDTISREVVRELLSDEWFELLSTVVSRSGTIKHTGERVIFQKFSSMGNGFTFELESLIFWALSQATMENSRAVKPDNVLSTVSVFGDDLIVPSYCFDELVEVLSFCGFTTNSSKSFKTGPFRESCGKDFFLGTNVRPFFIKEKLNNAESIIRLANAIRRYAHRRNGCYGCDARFRDVHSRLIQRLPKDLRGCKISEGYGDVGILANLDEAVPTKPRDGWEGMLCRAIVRVPYRVQFKLEQFGYTTVLFRAVSTGKKLELPPQIENLLGGEVTTGSDRLTTDGRFDPRDRTFPKMATLLVREWYNLGPWL